MRLVTAGRPHRLANPVVGRVALSPVPTPARSDRILLSDVIPDDLDNYLALMTTDTSDAVLDTPSVMSLRHSDHLQDGDIIVIETDGFVRTLYRPYSKHNFLFITERCSSNCLMCSQPPRDHDDSAALTDRNLKLIELIKPGPPELVLTGGEPTLLGEQLFSIVSSLRDNLPSTYIHILTNGRRFAWQDFTQRFAELAHPDLVLGIPLYSDDSTTHDFIVQAKDAFCQTMMGFQQLERYGIRTELRVVLHAVSVPRLVKLAEFIYRNLTFVEHIALMGLENIGYTPRNMSQLWVDPYDYGETLNEAVELLRQRGMNVSIYNHQLCVLPEPLWKFARKSISDWKNAYIEECDQCSLRNDCGGLFKWADKVHSKHIKPFPAGYSRGTPSGRA